MKLQANNDIEILRTSDSRYERLTMEIWFQEEPIILISQDRGLSNLEIEFFLNVDNKSNDPKLPLDDLLIAIQMAKDSLERTD